MPRADNNVSVDLASAARRADSDIVPLIALVARVAGRRETGARARARPTENGSCERGGPNTGGRWCECGNRRAGRVPTIRLVRGAHLPPYISRPTAPRPLIQLFALVQYAHDRPTRTVFCVYVQCYKYELRDDDSRR